MPDAELLDGLEEIDRACERARECADHMWQLAADRRLAADHAYEFVMALRQVTDETAALRIALASQEVGADVSDRITRNGGRVERGGVVLPFPGGDAEVPR